MRWILLALSLPAMAAQDFNGTTSKVVNTTADPLNAAKTLSFAAWVYADNAGESSLGRIFGMDESASAANRWNLRHNTLANTLTIDKSGTTTGVWTFSATDGQWNAICVTHDFSADANNPTARVGVVTSGALVFADATVTVVVPPVLATTNPPTGYSIGNETAGARTWDGRIVNTQVANVIWTSAECDQALRIPGSVRRGLQLYVRGDDGGESLDYSGNGRVGTNTSVDTTAEFAPTTRPVTNGGVHVAH